MLKEIQEIEKSDGALYLRFSNHPIAKTHSYQDGVVAVDIDHHDEVVGIELLALGPNETKTLSEIVTEFQLSLDALVHRAA
jgi:uncharacterized protein YuzE